MSGVHVNLGKDHLCGGGYKLCKPCPAYISDSLGPSWRCVLLTLQVLSQSNKYGYCILYLHIERDQRVSYFSSFTSECSFCVCKSCRDLLKRDWSILKNTVNTFMKFTADNKVLVQIKLTENGNLVKDFYWKAIINSSKYTLFS